MPVNDFQEKYDEYMLKFYDEGDSLDTQVKALQIHIDKGILNREEAIKALATLQGQDVEEFDLEPILNIRHDSTRSATGGLRATVQPKNLLYKDGAVTGNKIELSYNDIIA